MKTALGIIGAIALAIFVGYINSINHRKNRFAAASAKFRNVFINELKDIYPIPVNWPANIDEYFRSKFGSPYKTVQVDNLALVQLNR
jgi:hypothetical protein